MLGNAHGPAHDHAFGLAVHARGLFDLGLGQPGLRHQGRPGCGIQGLQVGLDAAGVLGNERMVEHRRFALGLGFALPLQQVLGNTAHDRHVSAQCRAEVSGIGGLGAVAEHFQRVLRVLEAFQTPFLERVEAHHLGTALHGFAQRFEHTRVVGAGVLANDEDSVCQFQVVKDHGALAHAQGLRHADAAGLVAHVRAVRKVVGPVGAHEQLIKKGRFVAGPTRGIELGLIG